MPDAVPDLHIGLMSGTSLDGVDGVLVDFSTQPCVLAHAHHGFATELRDELAALRQPGSDELHRAAVAAQHLARTYAAVVLDLLLHAGIDARAVRSIGAHGQTVRHRPEAGYTLQLNAPATLAELTGIDVVADFRSADIAAGGQGAPLVPAFHAAVFTSALPRVVVNIGGIANLTVLPGEADPGAHVLLGFDTGPGNGLLDEWVATQRGEPFDRDGAWAAGGHVDAELLDRLLDEPYFTLAPPKSTGRSEFDLGWLDGRLGPRARAPQDVQATLTRLTAVSIARAIDAHAAAAVEVIVCGGGARNATLMSMLRDALPGRAVVTSDERGVDAQHVEATAFAWLARARLSDIAGNVARATGARGPRILGAVHRAPRNASGAP